MTSAAQRPDAQRPGGRGPGERGRGRRPGGPDTAGQILDAARESFAAAGFGGTTIRGVAGRAGVDPALVHHYFGTKDDLFLAAMQLPVDPRRMLATVFEGEVEDIGARLLRTVLGVWDDPTARQPLVALVRSALAGGPMSEGVTRLVLVPLGELVRHRLGDDRPELRAQLVATQVLGLLVARYVLALEPLASMPREDVVGWVAPALQGYLDEPLPEGQT